MLAGRHVDACFSFLDASGCSLLIPAATRDNAKQVQHGMAHMHKIQTPKMTAFNFESVFRTSTNF